MIKETTKKLIKQIGFEHTFRGLRSDTTRLAARHRASQVPKGLNNAPCMVFIWIPKTAGTSVYEALKNYCGMTKLKSFSTCFSFPQSGAVTFGHLSYNDLLEVGAVQREFSKKAYKFSFVRCPYERAVSLYNYLQQLDKVENDKSFNEFLDDVHRRRPAVGLYNSAGLSQANPQADWLIGTDGEFLTDHVFKIDHISQFCRELEKRYGRTLEIENLNVSKKNVITNDIMHREEILEKIEEIYGRDFDLLGYEKISQRQKKICNPENGFLG